MDGKVWNVGSNPEASCEARVFGDKFWSDAADCRLRRLTGRCWRSGLSMMKQKSINK